MHFKSISAWTVNDVAVFALIAIFSIGLVLYVVGVVRHWAKLRAEENKRRREEAIRIVRETAPELAAFRKGTTDLRDFVVHANAYRPTFITRFHWLMSFFPRDYGGSGDGPDPEPWDTTVGNLLVPKAHDVYSIYTECLSFKVPPPPEYPRAELPRSDIKSVADGAPRGLRKLYTRELSRAEKVQQAANQLQNEFAEQKRKAEEARDLMDIHIAKEKLAYDEQLAPITNVHKEYSAHTRNGIAGHFQLALIHPH
jgi:hypothetical protein